ncbi:MAG TPA: WYL domain-containing protein [Acidimicrobiales bacterium]
MNRTDRLYAIVEELRAAGDAGRTAAWLAERFEVSTRTIKRDVTALQQAGVPVWASPGPGGGYVVDGGGTLPPLTFTAGEATAVAIALAAQPGLPFGPDGRSALTKLLGAMSPDGRRAAEDLAGHVWTRPRPGPTAERSPVARVLDEAVRERVVVVIDYVDARGRATSRRPVEPLAFAQNEGRWYLLAWCRRRRDGRWFRLDRIVDAWATAEPFAERDLAEVFGEIPPDAATVRLG